MRARLASLHVPSIVAGLAALVAAQVSVTLAPGWLTVAGSPVDLSSAAGRTAALLAILGVLVHAAQSGS
jgi:hypothetical protein